MANGTIYYLRLVFMWSNGYLHPNSLLLPSGCSTFTLEKKHFWFFDGRIIYKCGIVFGYVLKWTSVIYCPTTEVLKPGAKTRWGFSQEICCERPTGDPVESGHLESWNRGVTIKIMGISWMIYWEYHSPTLGSKDVPNISPIHVFTHLHQCIFSDCSMIHTFLEWCSMFFHGRSIPPHLLSPNGACSPQSL